MLDWMPGASVGSPATFFDVDRSIRLEGGSPGGDNAEAVVPIAAAASPSCVRGEASLVIRL